MGVRFGNIPNDQKPCGEPSCNNTRNKNDKYCKNCRREINRNYKKMKKLGYVEKLMREFVPDPRISMPDIGEDESGIPYTWSNKSNIEWSTKYSFNNFKFKLISNRIK